MQIINFSKLSFKGIKPKHIIFPDGEFKLAIQNLPDDNIYVIVVQTDKKPMEKIFATAMLIDIVKQKKPEKIIVVHPWLSFSRQDRRFIESEPLSIDLLLKFYIEAGATDLVSCDIHTTRFRNPGIHKWKNKDKLLTIHNINIIGSFYNKEFSDFIIVSPTGTDEPFLKPLRDKNVPITYFKKEKYCDNCNNALQKCLCESGERKPIYKISSDLDITNKKVLVIDDIIAGGGTMLSTINQLKNAGASEINIFATHGFFNDLKRGKQIIDSISAIYISNTVQFPKEFEDKVNIVDCVPILIKYLELFK